ncbi:MAG: hypothetical protein QXP53_00525 [Candidatus Pacearchaeota archaeon]
MAKGDKIKLVMVMAASKALDYKRFHPNAESEEIFQHIMKEIPATGKTKAAAIAAVDRALQYKELEKIKDKDVLQRVMNELDVIIKKVE